MMNDAEIVSCNIQEWADYLSNKYYIANILIFETNVEKSLSETIVKIANPFRGHPYERDFFEINGVKETFKILFDRNPDLVEYSRTVIFCRYLQQRASLILAMRTAEVLR